MTPQRLKHIFITERDRFNVRCGLGVSAERPRKARDKAFVDLDTAIIWFYGAALEKLTEPQARALLRHEMGHILCPEGSERDADRIAEAISGEPIYYDAGCVQTLTRGVRPRPAHLPR